MEKKKNNFETYCDDKPKSKIRRFTKVQHKIIILLKSYK